MDISEPLIANKNSSRVIRSATIRLNKCVADVFPLFGPIREMEWAFGWTPEIIHASTEVEEKMIFRTKGADGDYAWTVTKFAPANYLVEYLVSTQNRIWFITVSCVPEQSETLATVTYTYTALVHAGIALNEKACEEMFRHDLKDWEEAINFYLETGRKLQPEQASFN